MKKQLQKAGQVLVALLCAVTLITAEVAPVAALTWSDVNSLKTDAGKLKKERKELQAKLNALSKDKSQALNRKQVLDKQVANTTAQIQNAEKQISNYTTLIDQTQRELEEAQAEEERQYELFCLRVRSMEERGDISAWSVLFKASSFADMLSRLDAISEIMAADQKVIDDLQTLQTQIEEKKSQLEEGKKESERLKADLVTKKKELDTQRAEANKVIQELQANASETEAAIDGLEEEEESIQKEIQRLSKELAEKEAAANQNHGGGSSGGGSSTPAAKGGYIWPVNSRRITSPYGPRPRPGGFGSRYHKGVDIGGVGYTTPVHAAKAGTVIVSKLSRSYGNYVVVSHGSGNTTLYAHMSSRSVKVGQRVNQGDVLGITGSTGNSTGPHLHFEITENGNRVNPMNYLG